MSPYILHNESINSKTKAGLKLEKGVLNIFTDRSEAPLLLWIIFVIYVSYLPCFLVCSLEPCCHLLEKGGLLALLYVMFYFVLSLFHVCPGSGWLLDCIDS